MKYLNFICYSLLLMLLFNTSSLYAAPPLEDHTTHTPLSLMPEPLSGSHDTFSLAATWWLPDWQGGQGTRGSSDDVGGGDIGGNCEENYGMHTPSSIDDKYTCSKYNYNVTSSLKCHVNCRCKDEYQYTSSNCSGNYTPSGSSCDGKYNTCTCKSEFQYNSSNCSGEYEVSGTSCDGNYNGCTCKSEFQYNSSNCSGNYTTAGTSCDGKYNACVCKSEFKYNSSNCSGEYEVSGMSCGGNYNGCTIRPDCAITSKDCDYGCASTNSCGKCTECKTCIPNADCTNANYPFSSESIAYATFTSCTPGCRDNTPKYKFQSCVSGYVNTDTFWCGKPATLNCAALGYTKSSCSGGLTAIGCPFDSSKKACLDFN